MRDDLVLVDDILREVNYLLWLTDSISYESLIQDETKLRAAERSFEIIGEASSNITSEFRLKWPDVPWRIMTDMRNVIIHDYFEVDYLILWDTIRVDLPDLKQKLDTIISS